MSKFPLKQAHAQGAGDPYVFAYPSRGYTDGATFELLDRDLTGETLQAVHSVKPGAPALGAPMTVSVIKETKTWQEILDENCKIRKEDLLPCGAAVTDSIDVSKVTIGWNAATFNAVPNDPDDGYGYAYFEIRRTTAPTGGPLFLAGQLTISGKVQ